MASLMMHMGWSGRLCRLAPILAKMFSVTLLKGWLSAPLRRKELVNFSHV